MFLFNPSALASFNIKLPKPYILRPLAFDDFDKGIRLLYIIVVLTEGVTECLSQLTSTHGLDAVVFRRTYRPL